MAGTTEQAHLTECQKRIVKFSGGWGVMGNIPDFPVTLVFNYVLRIVTQKHDKNYVLLQYLKMDGYHPRYSVSELEMLLDGVSVEVGLGIKIAEIPSGTKMRELFDKYVAPRLIEERNRIDELLGIKK